MRTLLAAAMLAQLAVVQPIAAQAAVPAANLVVLRRQQVFGSTAYTWAMFQDAAITQTFSSAPVVVPAGKHLVITGVRYWLTGTNGGTVTVGPFSGGTVGQLYLTRALIEPAGTQATIERSEHFTNGIAWPGGSQLDLKFTKNVSTSSDTIVWAFLYGYLE
jgi:hypothetical protein